MSRTLDAGTADFIKSATSYFEFEHRTEGLAPGIEGVSVHGGGHLGLGGVLGDVRILRLRDCFVWLTANCSDGEYMVFNGRSAFLASP